MNRTLTGCVPCDEEAARVLKRIPAGTTFEADVVTRRSRSGAWHRRYWALMGMIASNVERIEIEPGQFMPVQDAEGAHTACKYLTGLYDSFAIQGGVVRLLKSTAFDRMTAEEWAVYWRRLVDSVTTHVLPGVSNTDIENELNGLCGLSSWQG